MNTETVQYKRVNSSPVENRETTTMGDVMLVGTAWFAVIQALFYMGEMVSRWT